MSRSLVRFGGSVMVTMILGACTDTTSPIGKDIDSHHVVWSSQAIRDYSFDYEVTGFLTAWVGRPIRVEVRQGTVESAVFIDTDESIPAPATAVPTIDQLFEQASNAALTGALRAITFDAALGYPTRIQVAGPPDASGTAFVSNLHRLP